MRLFNQKIFASILLSVVPGAIVAMGCSGTTIKPDANNTSATDPSASGNNGSSGNNGNGSGTAGGDTSNDGGSGPALPASCPCPLDSYCNLSTNKCIAGCTDSSQCSGGRTCDTTSRTCKDVCTGANCNAQACPIPSAPAGTDASAVCNGVAIQGAAVGTTCHTGSAPAASGGAVRDGVYVMVSSEYYGTQACPTDTVHAVWDICGTTWASAQESSAGAVSYMMTVSLAGSTANLSLTCPAPTGQGQADFTATDTTLDLYWADGAGGTFIEHYAKE